MGENPYNLASEKEKEEREREERKEGRVGGRVGGAKFIVFLLWSIHVIQ